MKMDATLGLIRHFLTFGGGMIVTSGLIDQSGMESLVGAAVTIVGVVWSSYNAFRKEKALNAAIAAPVGKAK